MSSTDTAANTGNGPSPATGEGQQGTNNEAGEQCSNNTNQGANATRNRNTTNNNSQTFRISNFKGEVSDVGAVIGTKSENRTKDSMSMFEEKIASYVMCEYKKGRDIVPLIKKIESVDTSKWKPTTPTAVADAKGNAKVPEAEMMEYKLLYGEYLSRKNQLAENEGSLYSLIKGQCTPALVAELKGLDDFSEKDSYLRRAVASHTA